MYPTKASIVILTFAQVPSLYDPNFEAKLDHGRGAEFFYETTRQLHTLYSAYGDLTKRIDQTMKSAKQTSEKLQSDDDDAEDADTQELQASLSHFLGNVGETRKALKKASQEVRPLVLKAEKREWHIMIRESYGRENYPEEEEWLNEEIRYHLGSNTCRIIKWERRDREERRQLMRETKRRLIDWVMSQSRSSSGQAQG